MPVKLGDEENICSGDSGLPRQSCAVLQAQSEINKSGTDLKLTNSPKWQVLEASTEENIL